MSPLKLKHQIGLGGFKIIAVKGWSRKSDILRTLGKTITKIKHLSMVPSGVDCYKKSYYKSRNKLKHNTFWTIFMENNLTVVRSLTVTKQKAVFCREFQAAVLCWRIPGD